MGAHEGTGDLIKGGRAATIGGISVAHSGTESDYYFQRGVLMIPDEALDDLLEALGRLGLGKDDAEIEPIGQTGVTQITLRGQRVDHLVEDLGGTIPVEPSYVLFPASHVRAYAAARPIPAAAGDIPRGPLAKRGQNVNIGVVDLGFFDPAEAGHPAWATKGVVLDKVMSPPSPRITHHPFVGHGNAIVGILKQLAPAATVYTSTIETQASDSPGGTTDRRLGEAIERLLCQHRIHILVIPFGGSTRLGTMPVTERVLEPHLGSTLVVASAGNEGLDPTMYPAADPDVVGVGAWMEPASKLQWLRRACASVTTPARSLGRRKLAPWSNRGAAVELGAAGVKVPAPFVKATLRIGPGRLDRQGATPAKAFNGWGLFTGTSFAAAVAAGCIAGDVGGECCPSPAAIAAAAMR